MSSAFPQPQGPAGASSEILATRAPARWPVDGAGLRFGVRVGLVWTGLLAAFAAFVAGFDLDLGIVREKFPSLLGFHLSADGALQGVPLTLLVSAAAMAVGLVLGLLSALGKISSNPLAYGIATSTTPSSAARRCWCRSC